MSCGELRLFFVQLWGAVVVVVVVIELPDVAAVRPSAANSGAHVHRYMYDYSKIYMYTAVYMYTCASMYRDIYGHCRGK